MSVDQEIPSPLLPKDTDKFLLSKSLTFDNTKAEKIDKIESDKKMEDVSTPAIIDKEINIKMEIEEPKPQKRKSVKRRSRKCVMIEYSKVTNELKVIINKIKGEKVRTKIHKTVTLREKKIEKPLSKETKEIKTPIKNLKLKTKRSCSLLKNISKEVKNKIKKAPVKKEKTDSIKSFKRVLLKTKVTKEIKSRTLRSGVAVGNITKTSKSKQSPRTRSQKKQSSKREPSKSKRKLIV